MVPVDRLLAFSLAALILIVIPGPSVLFSVGRALALGKRGGVLSVVGNTLGTVPIVIMVAFGLGLVVARSLLLLTIIKIVGAGYIIYLGVQAIRHRHGSAERAERVAEKSNWRLVREGFIVGLTNPKTIAFFVAVLPQFIVPTGNVPLQILELGLIFLTLGLVSDCVWAVSAGAAREWFSAHPERLARVSGIGGGMMIGLGGVLLLSTTEHA